LIKGRDVPLTIVLRGPPNPGTICAVSTREVGTQPCITWNRTLVGSSAPQVLNHCAISASANMIVIDYVVKIVEIA